MRVVGGLYIGVEDEGGLLAIKQAQTTKSKRMRYEMESAANQHLDFESVASSLESWNCGEFR